MPYCFNHSEIKADWFCPKCREFWCQECARVTKGICKSFAFCPECRDFCEKLESDKEED